jgi:phosphatidylglycerol:prolipoprotein diacylglycerol transferase
MLPEIPQILHIGPLSIHTYGITFASGVIAAYFVGRWAALKRGISPEHFDDIAFWAVVIGFISARVYYVLTYPQYFSGNVIEIFKTWDGGLSIFGGILGGMAAVYFRVRKLHVTFLNVLDAIVIGLPLGQAIGRIGNYINHEAFGYPTSLPWKIFIPIIDRPAGYMQFMYFQPTFLYEMIADLAIFLALFFWFRRTMRSGRRQKRAGIFFATYLVLYGIARYFIEGLRLDSSYILGVHFLRFDQLIAILLFAVGCGILYRSRTYEA